MPGGALAACRAKAAAAGSRAGSRTRAAATAERRHHSGRYRSYARLARELRTAVQIGENFNGPAILSQALAAGACDFVMPDVARIGGVTGWMQAAGIAAAADIETSSHLMPEISAQLMCVTLGHKNKAVIQAIQDQARDLAFWRDRLSRPHRPCQHGRRDALDSGSWCSGGERKRRDMSALPPLCGRGRRTPWGPWQMHASVPHQL